MIKLSFYGAVMSVTGSCHLITTERYKILLDCGMFQGSEALEEKNGEDFPFVPGDLDLVLLSHAHIDHSGRIPLLFNKGYGGKVLCTEATAELVDIMLQDSGSIQERDTDFYNKKARRSGKELHQPIYTQADAEAAMDNFKPLPYDQVQEVLPGVRVCFRDAGHILGSAIVEVWIKEKDSQGQEKETKLVFSGDIGGRDKALVQDPTFRAVFIRILFEPT